MLKGHATFFRRLMMFGDIILVTAAFFVGYFFHQRLHPDILFIDYVWILPVLLAIWGGSIYFFGIYESFRLKKLSEIICTILKTAILGFFVFTSFCYILKITYVSRVFIGSIFISATLFILLEKLIIILCLRHLRKKGFNFRNIILVGTGLRAQTFMKMIDTHKELGLKIIGLIDENKDKKGKIIKGCPVIGVFEDLPEILKDNPIDQVMFVVPRLWLGKQEIEEMIHYCETVGVRVSVAVDLFKLKFTEAKEGRFFGVPMLTFEPTSDKVGFLLLKRLLDLIISGIGLILLSPVFLVTAIIIKVTSKGPIFFCQERSGLTNRKFMFYKFRTMVDDAETQLDGLRHLNEMEGPVFKIENDPRLTKPGKFLRKWSIDEFPQLWNVFRGDISIVGPRPPIPHEVEKYDHWQRRRLSMKPGITCLWQINGRNKITDFDEWMNLDLKYIDNWSLLLDFKIMIKTLPAVFFCRGAK